MADFMIRFLLCNLWISIIVLFLAVKYWLRERLTRQMHYNLWFLLLGLLAVPFLPASAGRYPGIPDDRRSFIRMCPISVYTGCRPQPLPFFRDRPSDPLSGSHG